MRPLLSGALYLAAVGAGSAMIVEGSRSLVTYAMTSLDLDPAGQRPLSRVERQLLVQNLPLDSEPKPLRRVTALNHPGVPAAILAMQMDRTEHALETPTATQAVPLPQRHVKLAVLSDVAPVRVREWVRVVPVVKAGEPKKLRKLRLARSVSLCGKRKTPCHQAQKRLASSAKPESSPFEVIFDTPLRSARRVHIAETPSQLMFRGLLGRQS